VLVQKLERTIVPFGLYFDIPCYCLVYFEPVIESIS